MITDNNVEFITSINTALSEIENESDCSSPEEMVDKNANKTGEKSVEDPLLKHCPVEDVRLQYVAVLTGEFLLQYFKRGAGTTERIEVVFCAPLSYNNTKLI